MKSTLLIVVATKDGGWKVVLDMGNSSPAPRH